MVVRWHDAGSRLGNRSTPGAVGAGEPLERRRRPAAAAAPAAKTPPPVPITDADLKAIAGPKPDDLAKGDPGGTLTGTVNDIVVSDSKKGLTLADLVNMVGQNRIAINFVWTLVTGYLVMFMQAGFAAGRNRAVPGEERQSHHDDELHGVWVRAVRLLGDGLRDSAGGLRAEHQPRRAQSAQLTNSRSTSSAASPGDFSDSEGFS